MQKPIVGPRFRSKNGDVCYECLALANKDKEKVLTANLPSRIAFASFIFFKQDAPSHTRDYLHA